MFVEYAFDVFIIYNGHNVQEIFFGDVEQVKKRIDFLQTTYTEMYEYSNFSYTPHRVVKPEDA